MFIRFAYPLFDPSLFDIWIRCGIILCKICLPVSEAYLNFKSTNYLVLEKDGYITPIDICALNFMRAVTETKMSSLKHIYLVLRNKEDETDFLEFFSDAYKISSLPVISSIASDGDNIFDKNIKSKSDDEGNCRPSCVTIYKRETENQPPGTLSFSKCDQSPEGFNDSKDCIILRYHFPNGHQGVSQHLL